MSETTTSFVIQLSGPSTSRTVNISNPKQGITETNVEDFADAYATVYQDDYSAKRAYYQQTTKTYVIGGQVV